jgi:hypothetical protein
MYARAVVGVGMLGEGGTHGSPVCSQLMCRFQPRMGTTERCTICPRGLSGSPETKCLLKNHAVPCANHLYFPATIEVSNLKTSQATEMTKDHSASRESFRRMKGAKPRA